MSTHGPIEKDMHDFMNGLAKALDDILNPGWDKGVNRKIGFALLTYHFGENIEGTGRINYIGNGSRPEVLVGLKELVARWEGRHPEEAGQNTEGTKQ